MLPKTVSIDAPECLRSNNGNICRNCIIIPRVRKIKIFLKVFVDLKNEKNADFFFQILIFFYNSSNIRALILIIFRRVVLKSTTFMKKSRHRTQIFKEL